MWLLLTWMNEFTQEEVMRNRHTHTHTHTHTGGWRRVYVGADEWVGEEQGIMGNHGGKEVRTADINQENSLHSCLQTFGSFYFLYFHRRPPGVALQLVLSRYIFFYYIFFYNDNNNNNIVIVDYFCIEKPILWYQYVTIFNKM